MAITERTVQNKRNSVGELTGKPGIVYDVNIKHKVNGQQKTHSKKGFATKKEALQYEAAMKNKLSNPSYVAPTAAQRKMTVEEYLEEWVERHGNANLRPSTKASYRSHIRNHVIPYIGSVPLGQVTPAMLDDMFRQLYEKGLSHSSVKYAHRVVGVAFEHARKYHYIENNPARDVITKFGKQGKTPDPYTTEQMSTLFANVAGSKWELINSSFVDMISLHFISPIPPASGGRNWRRCIVSYRHFRWGPDCQSPAPPCGDRRCRPAPPPPGSREACRSISARRRIPLRHSGIRGRRTPKAASSRQEYRQKAASKQ